ncbi:hypothetical protein BHE74_00023153 [Ensete ventricosum]|nr:hypothetical protein BHE74_00023153 [Ensete ventricosum]
MTQSDRPRGEVHVSYSRLSGPCTMHATRRPLTRQRRLLPTPPAPVAHPSRMTHRPLPPAPPSPSFPLPPGPADSEGDLESVGRTPIDRTAVFEPPQRISGWKKKVEMDRRLMAKGERKAQGNMPASPAAAASSCFHARGRRMGCCRGEAKRRITASRIPVLRRVPHLYPTCAAPSPCLPLPRDPSTAHYF